MQVKEGVEFAVTLTDRPGSLAQLIKKLTATGVSIEAFMLYTSYIINIPKVPRAAGICKLLVDNVEKARDALKELDVMFWEEKVVLVRVPDRQGLLLSLLERLSEGGVNLRDGYASASSGEEVLIVLSVSNTEQALSVLSTEKSQTIESLLVH